MHEFDENIRTTINLKTWSGAFQGSSQSTCPPQYERYDEKIEKQRKEIFKEKKFIITEENVTKLWQTLAKKKESIQMLKKYEKGLLPGKCRMKREVCSFTEHALQVTGGETTFNMIRVCFNNGPV